MSRSRIIAVANQKGGVGKTTTSINLAACLAELGNRVLVVDMDPQANATTGLGVDPKHVDRSVYNVLLDNESISNITEATAVGNLLIAPSSLSLASAEIELFNVFKREQRLDLALQEAKAEYDFIFIDCPPTLGLLTINAFSAAKEVMLPIQCEYFALEGVAQLTHAMSEIQVHLNPDLAVNENEVVLRFCFLKGLIQSLLSLENIEQLYLGTRQTQAGRRDQQIADCGGFSDVAYGFIVQQDIVHRPVYMLRINP